MPWATFKHVENVKNEKYITSEHLLIFNLINAREKKI